MANKTMHSGKLLDQRAVVELKVVTKEDIEKMFGKDIVIKL